MRFGVEEREAPGMGSSGGAELGDRIAARERCGEGIVAVWGLLRPGRLKEGGF